MARTFDGAALEILMDSNLTTVTRDRKLEALRHQAAQAVGSKCPACGGTDIEDGYRGEVRCCDCGHQWNGREV